LVAGELAAGVGCKSFPHLSSPAHRIEESLVIGLAVSEVEISRAGALLALHLVEQLHLLRQTSVWSYVNAEAQTLLSPLRAVPLRRARWILRRSSLGEWCWCFWRPNWPGVAGFALSGNCRF